MSFSEKNLMSLTGEAIAQRSGSDLKSMFSKILDQRTHGMCFSPYTPNQSPGSNLTPQQIQDRLDIIKPFTHSIRTFSCTDGNEMIPEIAKKNGLTVMVGAWLDTDLKSNEREIENLIEIARAGYADNIAVGNEVLYRGDLDESQLIDYIKRVKEALPDREIGYVDAYYEFCQRPALTELCDVIYANCYPYWEGCSIEYSLLYMKDMYRRAADAAKGKKVIISETGWPSSGSAHENSQPSMENALAYFVNTQLWAKEDNIDVYYFSSFDEEWKTGDEGDVGAFWGIWDKDGNLKFACTKLTRSDEFE